jgi:L-threonylcarbamoyladenylate synthase
LLSSISCQEEIGQGVACLKAGGVVVFPTDTLYGVGADVFSLPALRRVFALKGRPLRLALPVLVSDWEQVGSVAQDIPELGFRLAQRFWPGPLTLVLPRSDRLPDLVTGGLDTVAVRMPDHPIPLALAREFGGPITGTSANPSGQADLLTLEAVVAQLGHGVDYVIRCGPAPAGIPSTVVDVTTGTPRLVREGALAFQSVVG